MIKTTKAATVAKAPRTKKNDQDYAGRFAPKVNPDAITGVGQATGDTNAMFLRTANQTRPFHKSQYTKAIQEVTRNGMSYAAACKALDKTPIKKPEARLATGLSGKDAPHSALAAAQSRKDNAKAEPKVTPTKAEKRAVAKEAKAPKPTKTANDTKLTVLVAPKDSGLKVGSDRELRLAAIQKCKTVGEALAKTIPGGKRIMMDNLRGMVKRAHIKIG